MYPDQHPHPTPTRNPLEKGAQVEFGVATGGGNNRVPHLQNHTVDARHQADEQGWVVCRQALGLLVPVSSTTHAASTSGLSTRWSGRGPYPVDPVRDLILKRASRLADFSGYPCDTRLRIAAPTV